MGIDSLLILVIASRFREELPFDLDPSFFVEVYSIGAIKAFFNNEANPPAVDDGLESSGTSSDSESAEVSDVSSNSDDSRSTQPDVDLKEKSPVAKPIPRSTSIILQGNLNPTSKTMFMFPDGSGSATSYMHLPRLRGDIALVAMNCPYMTNPKEMQGASKTLRERSWQKSVDGNLRALTTSAAGLRAARSLTTQRGS